MGAHFNMPRVLTHIFLLLVVFHTIYGQDYHAIQGSSYAGSLGISNNPSSMLSNPFRWDVDILSIQYKNSTNILTIYNFSLLSPSRNSKYSVNEGSYQRKENLSTNLNLLNVRYAINRKHAIGFGCNLRSYARIKSGAYNYIDTIKNLNDFLIINDLNRPLAADFTGSGWLELFGSYAVTVWDKPSSRLNAGLTLKVSRGLAGAFLKGGEVQFLKQMQLNKPVYYLTRGNISYGYSSNFDRWKSGRSQDQNLSDFLNYTEGGAAMDLGVEYLIKSQAVISYDEDDFYDYDWKIGVSLLDVGFNRYKYGTESRTTQGVQPNITDQIVEDKFRDTKSLHAANDSLATIVSSINPLSGKYYVINPMRMVINADRFLFDAFYLNAELSINLSPLTSNKYHYVTEMNVLTVTPRWETKTWGAYLPIEFITTGKFWIGGAFKAGPLLFGWHNWANLFSSKKILNGGGYVAMILRSKNNVSGKQDRRLNCPQ